LEQFVLDQLASGKYQSSSDVVCEAVRLMRDRERRREELRREVDRGIAQLEAGEFVELDSEAALQDFFDDIEARRQQRFNAKRDEH
jgi:antitoxin ParD1/3/4